MQVIATNPTGGHCPSKRIKLIPELSYTILLVSQNEYFRVQLNETLSFTYKVLSENNLSHAHTLALEKRPDMVVINFNTNRSEALQLCFQLKLNRNTNHIPIILIGDDVDAGTRLTGLQFGADDCISGPFYSQEFLWRVRNLLQLCSNLQKRSDAKPTLNTNSKARSMNGQMLYRIMEVLEKNIGNASFDIKHFSTELGLSQIQLYRKILNLTGLTPNEFIRQARLKRAAELFQLQAGNISEVAYQVGFSNLSYFSKCFKEYYSCSPGNFIKRHLPQGIHWQISLSAPVG